MRLEQKQRQVEETQWHQHQPVLTFRVQVLHERLWFKADNQYQDRITGILDQHTAGTSAGPSCLSKGHRGHSRGMHVLLLMWELKQRSDFASCGECTELCLLFALLRDAPIV